MTLGQGCIVGGERDKKKGSRSIGGEGTTEIQSEVRT